MRLLVVVLSFLLWSAGAAGQPQQAPIGANKFDLFSQYIGTASGCRQTEPCRRVTRAMAQKAIEDARDAGIPFLRVSMSGPTVDESDDRNSFALWRSAPDQFWRLVDQMMDDLDSRGMRLVPVMMWGGKRFPVMTGETTGEMIANPNSEAWKLLSRFTTEFVTRYRARPTVLFYELTNELNAAADLDHDKRCARGRKRLCESSGNFSTDQLIAFTGRFTRLIKSLDDKRLVSSGFTIPRVQAEHLRARPEWSPGGPDWTHDSREQFARNLIDLHREVDIISIHLYGGERNQRFGFRDVTDLLAEAKRVADRAGKPLFVGEFGETNPGAANPGTHTTRMIQKILELRIPYAAVWVWEFYQRTTYGTHDTRPSRLSLEPGYTDFLIEQIKRANGVAAARRAADRPPRVVLTWPLQCAVVRPGQEAHAVASDDSGRVARVEFWLGDKLVAADDTIPYQVAIPTEAVPSGEHVLVARAFDAAGQRAEFSSRVAIGDGAVGAAECANARAASAERAPPGRRPLRPRRVQQ